jgi:hypothetical protein
MCDITIKGFDVLVSKSSNRFVQQIVQLKRVSAMALGYLLSLLSIAGVFPLLDWYQTSPFCII